jgi:hypothetical protein
MFVERITDRDVFSAKILNDNLLWKTKLKI